jgi:tetratricopeptide (TPR) repeat protein
MIAVNKDSTKVEALADVAKSFYEAKNYPKAVATYDLVNKLNPKGKGSLYNYYYHGLAAYFSYAGPYAAKQNPSKDILVKADSSFATLAKLSPTTYDAYLWRARVNYFKDSETAPKGIFVPYYQQFIDSAEAHVDKQTPAVKKNMVEAYNSVAGFTSTTDKQKAKLYWDKALAIDPQNATALAGIKSLSGPAPRAGKK